MKRRHFLRSTVLTSSATLSLHNSLLAAKAKSSSIRAMSDSAKGPIVISTWNHGLAANDAAWKVLNAQGSALDAVEQGVIVTEADPNVSSVGYGGFPDRDGRVTLDASIMDAEGRAGSVGCLEHIMHPISVARRVMEQTPHVMLVGDGALRFALDQGFTKTDLLTKEARDAWTKWKKESGYKPIISVHNHDTIGMIAIDAQGQMAGACTTSGLAWKIHGRVGDSPIIGAGMFVDNEVGGACATGKGESVMRIAGSALIVELMRQGRSPQEACEEAIKRIMHKQKDWQDFQVGFLALRRDGEFGAYALQKGFQFALAGNQGNVLHDSAFGA